MILIKNYDLRPAVVFAFVMAMLLIPTIRLATIIKRGYKDAATTQSLYTVKIGSARGTFYDRSMNKLTNETIEYVGTSGYCSDPSLLTSVINSIAKDPDAVLNLAKTGKPFIFDASLSYQSEDILSFPVYRRYRGIGNHLIGYATPSTESGYTGLESAFSDILDKYSGSISVSYTVDAAGRNLAGIKPVVDNTMYMCEGGIVLTLDKGLQEYCVGMLEDVCGTIIVMGVNGEILAFVSSPSFDNNNMADSVNDENSPFLNRGLSAYNVGSVFKTVVSAAALEYGINEDRSYTCTGSIDVGDVTIRCHNRNGHGEMNLKSALVNSCNPYFIDLAFEIGKENIIKTAEKMGLGREIILADGLYSKKGILPSSVELSPPAALANLAIGQGSLMATPLQITAAINCIATEGEYIYPSLVMSEINEKCETVEIYKKLGSYKVMEASTANTLLNNMKAVFDEGSLNKYKPKEFSAAGKTSTAQTGIINSNGEAVCQTWVAGIYPAEEPFCTVTVLIEDGVSGASTCGPIFKSVCDYIAENLL